jgi:hypothetical protein
MVLENAPAGLYQTRFENSSETSVPNTLIELKSGEKCTFTLDISDGAGSCSDVIYIDQVSCEGNGDTWTFTEGWRKEC